MGINVGVGKHNGEKRMTLELEMLNLQVSYLLRKEVSLLKSNVLVSKLIINCSSVSFLCLVSLKLPFKMQTLRSLMLSPSALKCNGRGRSFFCLIECAWLLNMNLKFNNHTHYQTEEKNEYIYIYAYHWRERSFGNILLDLCV